MWSAWLLNVVSEIEANVVESGDIKGALRRKIFEKIGFDSENNTVIGDGVFACGTMKQLRDITAKIVADLSTASPRDIDAILDRVWKTPDPVKLAFERANLNKLFRTLKSDMGLKVAICTTDDEDPTMQSLKALNAADLPDAILCGDMGIAPKPSRDQILYICKKIGGGIKPSETVMVGDTPRDMRMGRASGCALCIGILGGAVKGSPSCANAAVTEQRAGSMDTERRRWGGSMGIINEALSPGTYAPYVRADSRMASLAASENLGNLTGPALAEFMGAACDPSNIVVSGVAVHHGDLVKMAETYCGHLSETAPAAGPSAEYVGGEARVRSSSPNVTVSLAFPTPGLGKDSAAYEILGEVLGNGSVYTRGRGVGQGNTRLGKAVADSG
eukprot:g533.t1